MSVSKTHVVVGIDGAGLWVEDLHSTNGVSVAEPDGGNLALIVGRRVRILRGSTVHFGQRSIVVR
jgi:hypothetical protein